VGFPTSVDSQLRGRAARASPSTAAAAAAAAAPTIARVGSPTRVVFSDHGAERCARYGLAYADVGDVVLDEHDRRQRNPGSGDWIAQSGRLTVVYNWPDEDDQSSARVITAWLSG